MKKTLSVIVPVYNVEDFLQECVESLLAQTLTDMEIILVDDGSTDHSSQLCDKLSLQDSRIITVHKVNGGLSSARNIGLDYAHGNFITFVDSDDVILGRDTLEKVLGCFDREPELDVVQYDVIHKYLSPQAHKRIYPFTTYRSKVEIIEGYLRQHIHVSCCDKIFRAKIFESVRFPEGEISEDIALIPHIVDRISTLRTVPIGYYGYRYREGSISQSALPYNKIISILRSYYTYLYYAFTFSSLKALSLQIHAELIWDYMSIIRQTYSDKISETVNHPVYISISPWSWIRVSNGVSWKTKIQIFIVSVLGPKWIFRFQRLFTR